MTDTIITPGNLPVDGPLLTIVIPAYNEAASLSLILEGLINFCKKKNWKIILVNDGSKDETRQVLAGFSQPETLKIVHHKVNKGYGGAIKSGILACETEYAITIDADGQHRMEDVEKLFNCLKANDADMVVGSRKGIRSASIFRGIGKSLIRMIAKMLMPVPIHDINSGMKIYRTDLAKKYLSLTPDTMAYSDIITLVFINNRHLVLEEPITVGSRLKGKSTIGMQTAFQTVMEIINILILFNPLKVFLPLSILCFVVGLIIGLPILISGRGVSTGSLLGIFAGIIFFLLGLIAEQLSSLRKNKSL